MNISKGSVIIVCDSSALIALALCNQLGVLDELYHIVLLPQAVYDECVYSGKPGADLIAEWARNKVVEVENKIILEEISRQLDKGESEAITIYLEKRANLLLIDERRGSRVAEKYGINTTGSIGILLEAKK
jgi:predicted nucleic acid-binding protein